MPESLVPPPAVRAAARRGLEDRKAAPESQKGGLTPAEAHAQGIGSGVVRAQTLASGKAVSQETVNRMHSYFARHQHDHTPKGRIAWDLWGGDAGKRWADANAVTKEEQTKEASMLRAMTDELQKIAESKTRFLHDGKNPDPEGAMARSRLHRIAEMVEDLHGMLTDEDQLPAWVQDHITSAHENLSQVYSYMEPRDHGEG